MRHLICPQSSRISGLTLIELLVAISIMAVMAVLTWRGLDGMSRTQVDLQQHENELVALGVSLGQWQADLDAMVQQRLVPAFEWNGKVLRVTRRGMDSTIRGLTVVAWSSRSIAGKTRWLRWQSPPLTTATQLQSAWSRAERWGQNPSDDDKLQEVSIIQLQEWHVFYYRDGTWTNALSESGTSPDTTSALPDGVRLVLKLPPESMLNGPLTQDWVRVNFRGGKS